MPIVTLTPDQLRARHTLKWMRHTPDVLPMWVAEMDVATAPVVIEAVREAAEREVFGYAAADSRLPEATAAWCAERYAWQIDPSLVYPLPDVLCGIRLAIDCFTVQGSPIVLPVPAYAPFFSALDVTGRRGIFVRMLSHREADGRAGYRFDLDAIEDAFIAGAGGLILCNPYNPLGAVFPPEHLAEVCALAERYGVRVISDEIHATLVYDGKHVPTASVDEVAAAVTVSLLASTKGFNTAGLKCAQLVLNNAADASTLRKVNHLRFDGASTLGIEAAIAAYTHGGPWLDELLVFLRGSRDYIDRELLPAVPGLRWSPPAATYLGWLDFTQAPALQGEDPSTWLLREAKVALNAGHDFDPGVERCARLNFGTSLAILEEFVSRVRTAVSRA